MDKKDFSNLEDQITSTVSNALKAIDFANLKRDINHKTENTLSQFKSKFNGYSEKYINLNKKAKNDVSKYISKRPAGNISGIFYILFGGIASFMNGISLFSFLIVKMLFNGFISTESYMIFVFLLVFFGVSVALLVRGLNLRKRVKRFKIYVRFIGDNNYIPIKDLAKFAKEKESFIVKDLSKMIDLGMFLEGHIDEQKIYFMINDEVYRDDLNYKKQQMEKEIIEEKSSEEIYNSEKKGVESNIEVGRNYIQQITNVKNEICEEEIAIKLDKLINIANQIISYVEKNPKKIQEVDKFINHYLPVTIKLVNSYKELNNQLVQGDNIKNAKSEIQKSIDLINSAFENLLDDLFEDIALDISTDISVLKTLFKQEGLGQDDFKN